MDNNTPNNIISDNSSQQPKKTVYYSPSKIGVFVGIISFFLVSFLAYGGVCCLTIFLSVGIGSVAGWATARYSNVGIWSHASEYGSISGRIAGIFVFFGHLVGSILPSLLFRIGAILGLFSSIDMALVGAMNYSLFTQGLINGTIGFVLSWASASFVARKVYENDNKQK